MQTIIRPTHLARHEMQLPCNPTCIFRIGGIGRTHIENSQDRRYEKEDRAFGKVSSWADPIGEMISLTEGAIKCDSTCGQIQRYS
jgi:hypothetical protein